MKPCFNKCKNFYTETTQLPTMFLIYKCKERIVPFGILSDCDKKMPDKCKEYEKM